MKNLYLFTLLITSSHLHAADNHEKILDAIRSEDLERVQLVVDSTNVNIRIGSCHTLGLPGYSLLHYAIGYNDDIALYFISIGADINTIDNTKETPLHRAVRRKKLTIIQKLLDSGAHTKQQNIRNHTPKQLAKLHGFSDIVQLIDNYDDGLEIKEPDPES